MAGSSGMIVIVIQARRRRYIQAFMSQGASSEQSAKTLAEIGERDGHIFRQMVRQGIFVQVTGSDKYYLDQGQLESTRSRQRGVGLILMGLLALIVVLIAFLGQ